MEKNLRFRKSLWLVALIGMVMSFLATPATPVRAGGEKLRLSVQPLGAVNGANLSTQPTIQLTEANGTLITADSTTTVTATIATGVGNLTGTTTVTASNGVATFTNLQIVGTAGSFTLLFTASQIYQTVTSESFALTFGAATASAITTQPSGAVNGVDFTGQPVIRIVDSGGNTVTNSTVNVGHGCFWWWNLVWYDDGCRGCGCCNVHQFEAHRYGRVAHVDIHSDIVNGSDIGSVPVGSYC